MGCIIPWESDAKAPTSTTSGLKNSPSNVDLQEVVWRWCQAAGTDMDSLDGAEACRFAQVLIELNQLTKARGHKLHQGMSRHYFHFCSSEIILVLSKYYIYLDVFYT